MGFAQGADQQIQLFHIGRGSAIGDFELLDYVGIIGEILKGANRVETQSPIGLPIGSSGLFMTGVRGKVSIDTRGLFEFGGGKVRGVLNADGKLWVAWSPIDIGFEINVRLGSWFRGFARAHLWQGQGWQNRWVARVWGWVCIIGFLWLSVL